MNPPPNLRNPPLICETVQGPEKSPSQGPKNDRNDPEKIPRPRHTYSKHILQKMVQNDHVWPQQWSDQSTSAYIR